MDARTCQIRMLDSNESLNISHEFLEPVRPDKKDQAMIMTGSDKGISGMLLSIDGGDGIFRVPNQKDFKIVSMQNLVKVMD